jgi:hypothetical protein
MKDGGGIRDTDKGMEKIRQQIAALSQLSVKAGIIEGTGGKSGVSVAQYAAYNEFGVPGKKKKWRIPPRPFIRGFVENEPPQGKPCGIEDLTLQSSRIRGNKSPAPPD